MNDLERIVYLKKDEFNALIRDGSVVIDGETIEYASGSVFVVADDQIVPLYPFISKIVSGVEKIPAVGEQIDLSFLFNETKYFTGDVASQHIIEIVYSIDKGYGNIDVGDSYKVTVFAAIVDRSANMAIGVVYGVQKISGQSQSGTKLYKHMIEFSFITEYNTSCTLTFSAINENPNKYYVGFGEQEYVQNIFPVTPYTSDCNSIIPLSLCNCGGLVQIAYLEDGEQFCYEPDVILEEFIDTVTEL